MAAERVRIKRAGEQELDAVMRLWLAGNVQAHGFIPEAYWHGHFEEVRKAVSQSRVYVAYAGGAAIGFIGLVDGYVAGLFVDEHSRGSGVGRRLLARAKAENSALTLQVYRQNAGAVRFYRREGFVVASEQYDEQTGQREYTMRWQREK